MMFAHEDLLTIDFALREMSLCGALLLPKLGP